MFRDGPIDGVKVVHRRRFSDERGWLMELYRQDELPPDFSPVMSYISMTLPGVARGPHLHMEQTDCFVFIGSVFKLSFWDERAESSTYGNKLELLTEEDKPVQVIVPPGVVHAYKNIGDGDGLVINFPNRLFGGWGRKQPVDEVRYEGNPRYKAD